MNKHTKQKLKYMNRKRRKRRLLLSGLFCAVFFLLFGIVSISMYSYVRKFPKDVIAQNVYIGFIDVSGKTKEEGETLLLENEKNVGDCIVSFIVGEQKVDLYLKDVTISYKEKERMLEEAISYGKKGNFYSRYWKLKKLKKEGMTIADGFQIDQELLYTFLEQQVKPHSTLAIDASVTKDGENFVITKEKEGKTLDIIETTKECIKHLNEEWNYEGFQITVTEKVDKPKIIAKDLEDIKDLLGSYVTDAGGGARVQNIQVGIEKLNGTVLMSGEELSFLSKTVPFTQENGYVKAGAFEEGQVVDSYGGGICQVSTTLYNAVIYAELEIEERSPHSMQVYYVEPSRDAAIAEDVKDLIFKNPYKTPIYIEGYFTDAGEIVFNIYGKETRKEGYRIEYESEVIDTEDYKVAYQEDDLAALGTMTEKGNASNGMEARLWKVRYQDGTEVSREKFNHSYYMRSDLVVHVGTASPNKEAVGIVITAINSQNKEKVYEGIARAKALGNAGTNSENTDSGEENGE